MTIEKQFHKPTERISNPGLRGSDLSPRRKSQPHTWYLYEKSPHNPESLTTRSQETYALRPNDSPKLPEPEWPPQDQSDVQKKDLHSQVSETKSPSYWETFTSSLEALKSVSPKRLLYALKLAALVLKIAGADAVKIGGKDCEIDSKLHFGSIKKYRPPRSLGNSLELEWLSPDYHPSSAFLVHRLNTTFEEEFQKSIQWAANPCDKAHSNISLYFDSTLPKNVEVDHANKYLLLNPEALEKSEKLNRRPYHPKSSTDLIKMYEQYRMAITHRRHRTYINRLHSAYREFKAIETYNITRTYQKYQKWLHTPEGQFTSQLTSLALNYPPSMRQKSPWLVSALEQIVTAHPSQSDGSLSILGAARVEPWNNYNDSNEAIAHYLESLTNHEGESILFDLHSTVQNNTFKPEYIKSWTGTTLEDSWEQYKSAKLADQQSPTRFILDKIQKFLTNQETVGLAAEVMLFGIEQVLDRRGLQNQARVVHRVRRLTQTAWMLHGAARGSAIALEGLARVAPAALTWLQAQARGVGF